ncbi:hypothetical protein [Sphingomonas sp.]|uniref:hypothetical protein n=1 Tax=Sphingomonas sp. TaxID=28214 RepID=UPI003D6CF813
MPTTLWFFSLVGRIARQHDPTIGIVPQYQPKRGSDRPRKAIGIVAAEGTGQAAAREGFELTPQAIVLPSLPIDEFLVVPRNVLRKISPKNRSLVPQSESVRLYRTTVHRQVCG